MSASFIPVNLRAGSVVRILARRYIVGAPMPDADGGVFTCAETGAAMPLTQRAILQMMRDARMTTDAAFRLLPASVLENLEIPLEAFSTLEWESGEAKYPFVAAVDKLPVKYQNPKKHIQPIIDRLMADPAVRAKFKTPPTARRVRTWFIRWLIPARDIRALIDNHRAKGNRTGRLPIGGMPARSATTARTSSTVALATVTPRSFTSTSRPADWRAIENTEQNSVPRHRSRCTSRPE